MCDRKCGSLFVFGCFRSSRPIQTPALCFMHRHELNINILYLYILIFERKQMYFPKICIFR